MKKKLILLISACLILTAEPSGMDVSAAELSRQTEMRGLLSGQESEWAQPGKEDVETQPEKDSGETQTGQDNENSQPGEENQW